MKIFKKAALPFAALMIAGCVAVFAGCGPEKDPDDGNNEVSSKLQFTGGYHDLRSFNMDFFILADMLSDGKGTIYLANYMGDPENISYSGIAVEWNVETDRDGLVTFNASTNDPNATFDDVSIYQESDGTFIWEYNFTFAGGYNRTTNLVGTEDIKYTLDSWKEYVKANASGSGEDKPEPEEPGENTAKYIFNGFEVIQVSSGNAVANMGISVTLSSDGTAKADRGYAAGGSIAFVYSSEEGSWKANEDGTLTVTFGDKTYTAVNKDGTYSFTYETSSAEEGEMTAVVSCTAGD